MHRGHLPSGYTASTSLYIPQDSGNDAMSDNLMNNGWGMGSPLFYAVLISDLLPCPGDALEKIMVVEDVRICEK